jgi:superfamily II DNA or RNA helicase
MPTRQSGTLRPSDREGGGPLTPQQVQRQLPQVYGRGIQLHRAGFVVLDRHDGNGASGRVQDDLPEPFAVRVALGGSVDAPSLESTCSCELRGDCEHAVALALAWQAEASRAGAPAASRPTGRSGPAAEAPAKPSLPCPWAEWLREVDSRKREAEEAPARDEDHILYLLALDDGRALVRPIRARALRTGRLGGTKPIELDDEEALERLSRLPPADRALLVALKFGRRAYRGHEPWIDVDSAGPGVLECLLETNRCHLDDPNGPVVGLGPLRPLGIRWRLHDDGTQTIEADVGGGTAFGEEWSWYHDPERQRIGRLEPGPLAGRLALLREAPAVQPDYRTEAIAALSKAGFADLPPPRALEVVSRRVDPRAVLTLDRPLDDADSGGDLPRGVSAMLEFRYGDCLIPANDARDELRVVDGRRVIEMPRDGAFEAGCVRMLEHLGLRPLADPDDGDDHPASQWVRPQPLSADAARRWVDSLRMQAESLRIDVYSTERFPLFVGPTLDAPELELVYAGKDWFEARLGIVVDGQRVDLYPILEAALRQHRATDGRGLILTLPDGRTALFARERLEPVLRLLAELETRDGTRGIARERVPAIVPPPDWRFTPGPAAQAFLREIERFDGLREIAPPPGFRAELRPYQLAGVAWLDFLRRFRFGGVLADDMGLGKTVQLLAFLTREKAEGRLAQPALVVCPTSVAPNWTAEAARFAPGLSTVMLARGDRSEALASLGARDLVVTNYALLLRDLDELARQRWSVVVFDEAQWLKNSASQGFRAAGRLKADLRLALSGTPVENHLGELKALFDLALPGLLGSDREFTERFRHPIERQQDEGATDSLRRRIRPFLLRRTKAEVASELPPRTTIERPIELGEAQRDLYESIRAQMESRVRELLVGAGAGGGAGLAVIDALLKLRQVCCDPALLGDEAGGATASAKREALLEFLPTLVEEGRAVLLFSQFTSMLDLIERDLDERGIAFARLDGNTADRARPVQRFQSGEVPLMLVSLKAGGVGLNLTRADTVILYDPWWNPAAEAQAIDRAHRIGQDKPVFVYELIASGTVEEKMQVLKARKRALAESIIENADEPTAALSPEELVALFER